MGTLRDFIDSEGGRFGRKQAADLEAFIDRLLKAAETNVEAMQDEIDDLKERCELAESRLAHAEERIAEMEGAEPQTAAGALANWSRGEDPAKVARVLEAIRGGYVSDLSLMF